MTLSRPQKLSHLQTILYEIDMLRYSAERLASRSWESEAGKWLFGEAFLLHFRNLLEFFGKQEPRDDDLTVLHPERLWEGREGPGDKTLHQLKSLAAPDLYGEYEAAKKLDKISRYLQHCTEQRVEFKEWHVATMFRELDTILPKFERLLPPVDKVRPWGAIVKNAVTFVEEGAMSTATVTKVQLF